MTDGERYEIHCPKKYLSYDEKEGYRVFWAEGAAGFAAANYGVLKQMNGAGKSLDAIEAKLKSAGAVCRVCSAPEDVYKRQALRCTVDGQPVSVHRLADGLCAVELTAGEHSLELGWTVPGATWGLCLSAAAAAMLAALWLFGRKKNKGGESHVHLHHR